MAKHWSEVVANPEYQALPDDEKEAARNQYFEQVVSPKAPQDKLDIVRQQFDAATRATPKEQPGLLEKAAGVVAAPGFAAEQVRQQPIESAKIVGKGLMETPQATGQKLGENVTGAAAGLQKTFDPNQGIGQRALGAGSAALNLLSIPFQAPITAIEKTYGKLAHEGSKLADPRFPEGIVSPEAASVYPSLFIGGASKKPPTDLQDAVKTLGMNFSKARTPEEIAAEITRAGKAHADRTSSWIWDRTPVTKATSEVGETGQGAVAQFSARKSREARFWASQEAMGNKLAHDAQPQIDALNDLRAKTIARADVDNPEVKKALAAIERNLQELGSPVESTVKTSVPGKATTLESKTQFAPKDIAVTKAEETAQKIAGKKTTTTSIPQREGAIKAQGHYAQKTSEPFEKIATTTKGTARPATVGDLVRAAKANNESRFSGADRAVMKELDSIINDPLVEVSKANKEFGRTRSTALNATKSNADIYRTDANIKKLGFDEDTMRQVRAAQSSKRMIPTDVLERISNGVDTINSPEKLLAARRALPKQEFSMLLRSKNAALRAEAGMDYDSLKAARPMLEEIYKYSRVPAAKAKAELDALEIAAKEMKRYKIPSEPMVSKAKGPEQDKLNALAKVLSMAEMYSNPARKMVGQAALKMLPQETAMGRDLKAFRGAVTPEQRALSGPSVGAAFATDVGNQ